MSPLEAPAPLPDALGPLSPSPTEQQEETAAMALGEQEVEVLLQLVVHEVIQDRQ